jgi:caffeoyl-CoA O-methyltransferase
VARVADLIDPAAERFAADHTTPFTGAAAAAAEWTRQNTSSPQMMAGVAEARLLQALVVATGARQVLEIGTFTGVGALSLAAALPAEGRVVTVEVDPDVAAVARRHLDASEVGDRVELVVGDALAVVEQLEGPFDVVWIDAWKADYPRYFDLVLDRLSERGVIAADNLFRAGRVLDPDADDENTVGMRDFARRVQEDARVDNVLLTIGDGVLLAWRRPG